jgi:hypothetical protein
VQTTLDETRLGWRLRCLEYTSQPGIRLRIWLLTRAGRVTRDVMVNSIGDETSRAQGMIVFSFLFLPDAELREVPLIKNPPPNYAGYALVQTRGEGLRSWPPERDTHLRRRFALLGQTLDGMRAYDLVRARAVLGQLPDLSLQASFLYSGLEDGRACLLAAILEPGYTGVTISGLDAGREARSAFLNFDRLLTWPQAVALLNLRPLTILTAAPERWQWDRDLADVLGTPRPWPELRESFPAAP